MLHYKFSLHCKYTHEYLKTGNTVLKSILKNTKDGNNGKIYTTLWINLRNESFYRHGTISVVSPSCHGTSLYFFAPYIVIMLHVIISHQHGIPVGTKFASLH